MALAPERLYELLPVVYREHDAAAGFPLRGLLRVVAEQAGHVERDIARLYEDLFIETCQEWVIPYIGDLVSNRLLFDSSRLRAHDPARALFGDLIGPNLLPPFAVRTRADVAKTIYYRRRKGTLPMLEELARDVTGWPVHAVEFFELLGWAQHLEHLWFQSGTVDVRRVDRMDRLHGPFDDASHTVDVRRIAPTEGWHNIRNIGFFLYRLGGYPLDFVPARQASAPWRYHFSPLGNPAPLFSRWRREGDEAGLSTELHVPAPIRAPFFYEDLVRYRNATPPRRDFTDLYGLPRQLQPPSGVEVCQECSFFIVRNGVPVVPAQNPAAPPPAFQPQIICRRLDPWPAAQPAGRLIAVDVATGRLAIGDGWPDATQRVDVFYHYGFAAAIGGGPYERTKWLVADAPGVLRLTVQEGAVAGPTLFPSLTAAMAAWQGVFARQNAVITILDSRTYALPAQVQLRNEGFLVIQADNQQRPLLQTPAAGLDIATLPPVNPQDPDRQAALTLSGVVVEGHLHVTGDVGRLRLLHCSLVPGRRLLETGLPASTDPSVVVDAGPPATPINVQFRLQIAASILGPIVAPEHAEKVWMLDSIVDAFASTARALAASATAPGPPLSIDRSTVLGQLHIRRLDMSESIVTGRVTTARTQSGCVRFSYVRSGSRTPRRYRCQPDLAAATAIGEALERNPALSAAVQAQIRAFIHSSVVPSFTTTLYGQPAYMQLRLGSPTEILTGAEDGSEMGAFCQVKQAQRESNLRIRLEEYLPFGLEAGFLYAT
jgi:hypothetical protein